MLADVTDADLQKQFDLAMQIRDKTSQANDAVVLVRGIKPQIDDREGQAGQQDRADRQGAPGSRGRT